MTRPQNMDKGTVAADDISGYKESRPTALQGSEAICIQTLRSCGLYVELGSRMLKRVWEGCSVDDVGKSRCVADVVYARALFLSLQSETARLGCAAHACPISRYDFLDHELFFFYGVYCVSLHMLLLLCPVSRHPSRYLT
jgi:hypothetical protein